MRTTHKRTAIINRFIEKRKYNSYLEIGVNNSVNFNEIAIKHKVGVDPVHAATYKLTSDDYFSQHEERFDVIFIDGMHLKEYVKRDILNALKILNEGGMIFCHDMNPGRKEHAQRIPSCKSRPSGYPKDWEYTQTDHITAWTGDVWETWVEFRKTNELLDMVVLSDGDQLGLIEVGSQKLLNASEDIVYDNLHKYRKEWLNLKSIKEYGNELEGFSW